MQIVLPWPPRDLHPNASKHWRAKLKAKQVYRDECFYLTKSQAVGTFTHESKIYTEITFHPPRNAGDVDGYLAAAKNGIDGMCYALNINDKLLRPILLDVGEKFPSGKIVIKLQQITS